MHAWPILQKVGFIRIDGRTPSEERQSLCDQFQHDAQTLVALLSITAANAGPACHRRGVDGQCITGCCLLSALQGSRCQPPPLWCLLSCSGTQGCVCQHGWVGLQCQ